MKEAIYSRTVIHILLIIVLGLIAYSNTFYVPFHFDDRFNIVENYKLRDLNNFWPPSGVRWFGFLAFALNYHFGGLNTIGYHVVNLIIHIFNAILVYWLVALTFKTPFSEFRSQNSEFRSQESGVRSQESGVRSQESVSFGDPPRREVRSQNNTNSPLHPFTYLPLFVALLFVAHPIQTQAVTYIVQRFTSLATMFYLLSLVMYIKFRSQQSAISGQQKLPATRYTLYTVSLLSAILAMKTKEISFTLPIIIVLYEFMFFEGNIKKRMLYLIPMLFTMLIIPLSLIGTDKPIGDAIGELREAAQETEEISRWSYLFTQFRVIVTYIRLLFLPINQNLDYDYPVYLSFLNPEVFLSFLFLLTIFSFAVFLLYTKRYTLAATRLFAFGIFWFFITLSVESSIIPIRDVINEHRLYLPSIGIIIAFISTTFYILRFWTHDLRRSLITCYLLLTTIVIALSVATYQRNAVWQDMVSLWEDVVGKSSGKVRGQYNLGVAYHNTGLTDKAIEQYQIVLELYPYSIGAYTCLGAAYVDKGWIDKAIEHLQIALSWQKDCAEVHYNLSAAYANKGWIDKAIEHLYVALRLKPHYADAYWVYNNLGNAYRDKGLTDKAIEQYQIVIKLKPNYPEAYYNLGNAYLSKGMVDEAIEHYKLALRLNPNLAETHNNLGLAYKQKGLIDEAMREFQEALRIQPDFIEARRNLESLQR